MKPWLLPAIACAALVATIALWPDGRPALSVDEQQLIDHARVANATHRLADVGLRGTVGLWYGPLPTQLYQLLLAIAGDDVSIVTRLHALLCAGGTAAALLWLAASLGWSPWLAPLPLCSPFFWHYARLLWDNPFAMPLGATLVAAWAAHLRTGGRGAFLAAAAAAIILPTVHPMTLPLAGVFAAHAVFAHFASFRRHARPLALLVVALALLNASYARQFKWGVLASLFAEPFSSSPVAPPGPRAFAFAWTGDLLSGYRFHQIYDPAGPTVTIESTWPGAIARDVSAVAFPLVWLGVGAIALRAAQTWRRRGDEDVDERAAPTTDVADVIGRLALLTLVAETVMHVASHVDAYCHYHIGTWPAMAVCLWAGLRALPRPPLATVVGVTLGVALLTVTVRALLDGG